MNQSDPPRSEALHMVLPRVGGVAGLAAVADPFGVPVFYDFRVLLARGWAFLRRWERMLNRAISLHWVEVKHSRALAIPQADGHRG